MNDIFQPKPKDQRTMNKEDNINIITPKKIIVFVAICLGMFMAILDIQIVASSLPVIAAGLSASQDELSWIQTSYLIAEVMIIPMTGFLSMLLSTRIFYFTATVGFTIMSILCAFSWNIESMIIFRGLQGLCGGALIPTAFASMFILFPKHMITKVTMFIGLIVTMAPTIGPTLGGYITDNFHWQVMFFMNLIPGIFVAIIAYLYIDFDQPNYKLLNNFDFIGVFLIMFSLGSLQYVLEEGNKKNWFEDTQIIILTILIIISFTSLIARELTCRNPIVNLRAFHNTNFAIGCLYSFILGLGLYGMVYLIPVFLFNIPGFNSEQIGFTMMVMGIFQLLSAPIAGNLVMAGLDKRIVLAIGFLLFGIGCYWNSFMTADTNYWELFIPQALRGLALMFCFIPINDIALGDLSPDEIKNASGLYNLTRNLGGAIGLAVINNILNDKTQIITQNIYDNLSYTSTKANQQIAMISELLTDKVPEPELTAHYLLKNIINMEAFIIAINNVFVIIGLLFIVSLCLLPFTKPTDSNNSNVH